MSDPEQPAERNAAGGSAFGRAMASLGRLNERWVQSEALLCVAVLILEVAALSAWVALRGLSTSGQSGSNAGLVFRGLIGAALLGSVAYLVLRTRRPRAARPAATAAVVVGALIAPLWSEFAVNWSSNLLNWFQQASSLTLWGGLRGIGTRLTLLLALLGGSLATAAGRHITIDLLTRFAKPRIRLPVVVVGWLVTALICVTAAWGFFDHIAIEDFGARPEAKNRLQSVGQGLSEDWFVARRQLALDARSLSHVLRGRAYSDWLGRDEWNSWLDEAEFAERYGKEAADGLKMTSEGKRSPLVVIPGKGEPRAQLVRVANLVVPIGLFIIGIRFILLALLTASGQTPLPVEHSGERKDDAVPDETARGDS